MPYLDILKVFGAISAFVILSSWLIASIRKRSTTDKITFTWFIFTGLIHCIVEGYWVVNWSLIPKDSFFLSDLWKEYAVRFPFFTFYSKLSDSRYMTGDTLVLGIEAITAFLMGPLSLLVAYLTLRSSPSRHFFQVLVSSSQIYGDYLYFFTTLYPGEQHYVKDVHGFYFWVYYVGMNAVWIIVPGVMLIFSFNAIKRAFNQSLNMKKKLI
jgi:cholestenol delta-isomerase